MAGRQKSLSNGNQHSVEQIVLFKLVMPSVHLGTLALPRRENRKGGNRGRVSRVTTQGQAIVALQTNTLALSNDRNLKAMLSNLIWGVSKFNSYNISTMSICYIKTCRPASTNGSPETGEAAVRGSPAAAVPVSNCVS